MVAIHQSDEVPKGIFLETGSVIIIVAGELCLADLDCSDKITYKYVSSFSKLNEAI
jgi:hypothetical protein